MLQQIGKPLGVFDIGFASWHRFQMLGIGDNQLTEAEQTLIHWSPIHPRTFHGDVGATSLDEPVAHADQFTRGSAEGTHFFVAQSRFDETEASDHQALMDIKPAAAGIKHFHSTRSLMTLHLSFFRWVNPGWCLRSEEFLLRAHGSAGQQGVVRADTWVHLTLPQFYDMKMPSVLFPESSLLSL